MTLFVLAETLRYLRNQSGFTLRYGRRIIGQIQEELTESNQPVSPELLVLFEAFQNPHVLTEAEKRQLFLALANYARTLVVDRSHGLFSLDDVYGVFDRETNGIISASKANSLERIVLIEKVFILSLILSFGRIPDSSGLIVLYRMMVQKMMNRDPTLQPLLALLSDGGGASVELMTTTFAQMFVPETLMAQG